MTSYVQLLSYVTLPSGEVQQHGCTHAVPALQEGDGSLHGKLPWLKASTVGLPGVEVHLALPSTFWGSN